MSPCRGCCITHYRRWPIRLGTAKCVASSVSALRADLEPPDHELFCLGRSNTHCGELIDVPEVERGHTPFHQQLEAVAEHQADAQGVSWREQMDNSSL
ncbi:hypothetical protein ZHAS_00009512 [Anopheles sinensis]|uniref:Uncharacterized protein n=1 Tax=Anopheles sinensis TaxID=74873 RepID=A0A084VVF3_ANOSI|nr:hypothetical protein ZHAS_00009512 [Anopheles sinensis]